MITNKSNSISGSITGEVTSSITGKVGMFAEDSPSIDAFGRWRTSEPETIFDDKNIFDDPGIANNLENKPLFYDNQQISGSGTSTAYVPTHSAQTISVSASTIGVRVRQTKMRFNYQPGKSSLILMTFNMNDNHVGVTKREGMFDDRNGIFLELDGVNVNFVIRSYASGTAVDTKVAQSEWNVDTMDGSGASGIELDFSKSQILFFDYEWLGVGRVRMGFVIDGLVYYAHDFLHTNNLATVYMSTPDLPLRMEIRNDGNGQADSLNHFCASVSSEGGQKDLGVVRYISTAGTHVDANVTGTIYALLGIRLKQNYLGASIKLINKTIQIQTASHKIEWLLIFNPTIEGTFTYADLSNSAIQFARGALANTVTDGFIITGGFLESGGPQTGGAESDSTTLDSAILLGSLIDGTADEIVLCARPIDGSTNVDIEAGLTWRELL